ncbi:DedA family protein [Isoptericola sp. b441]|uniref:DedA family protein n=1 Tax=Actinotalea lenta TaxID=3064654 RepID=A0ABT9D4R0_9CELL|nr:MULTISPECIES: DedA family protein [unclassified Isoptericola]MDO8105690.1 DedA family protein [Isoptericola sp. b441]MDO8122395.1 DedA family protein [Isoptericola sp. b490]
MSTLGDWVLGLTGTPWVFLALWALAVIDGFFPPVPSETVVIALASLAVSTGSPAWWLVAIVAALGAFTGDQVAYSIGKRADLRRRRFVRGRRAQEAMAWAERALHERGAVFIIAARYIPVGRVAVNMTAGGLRYPRARFTAFAAVAGVSWAVYTVALGSTAGVLFRDTPWIAVFVGVAGGVLLGMAADPLLSRLGRRLGWTTVTPQAAPEPVDPSVPPIASQGPAVVDPCDGPRGGLAG